MYLCIFPGHKVKREIQLAEEEKASITEKNRALRKGEYNCACVESCCTEIKQTYGTGYQCNACWCCGGHMYFNQEHVLHLLYT